MTPELLIRIGKYLAILLPYAAVLGWLVAGINAPVSEETDETRSSRLSRNNVALIWLAAFLVAVVVGHVTASEFISR